MRSEIQELAGGNEWRLFTSNFYEHYVNYGVSDNDYLILCNLIEKILKNLFKIDQNVSSILINRDIKCSHNIRSQYKKNKYCIDVPIKTELYSICFSFNLVKIDDFYVLGDCNFSIIDDFLLFKLPLGTNVKSLECISGFSLNQKYCNTIIKRRQLICHYHGSELLEHDCPTLKYEYNIGLNSIDFNFEYYYSDNRLSEGFSRNPELYFSFRNLNVSDQTLLKFSQFYKIIELYSSRIDVKDEFPEMVKSVLTSAKKTELFLQSFITSDVDVSDKILVFDMAKI
jgi:hypothetical protein